MSKLSGFTDAELAAFEWSKKQKELEESNKRKSETKHRTHKSYRRERRYRDSSEDSSFEELIRHRRNKRNNKGGKTTGSNKDNKEDRQEISKYRGRRRSRDKDTRNRNRSKSRNSDSSSSISYGNSRNNSRETSTETRKYNYKRIRSSSGSSFESKDSYNDLPKDPFNPLYLAYKESRYTSRRNRSRYVDKDRNGSRDRDCRHEDGVIKMKKEKENKGEDKWKHDLFESDGERASYEAEFRRKKIQQNIAKSYKYQKNDSKDDNYNISSYRDKDKDSSKENNKDEDKYNSNNTDSDSNDNKNDRNLITKRGWKSRAGGVYIPGDEDEDLYYDYTSKKSKSYERPDPSYTLD